VIIHFVSIYALAPIMLSNTDPSAVLTRLDWAESGLVTPPDRLFYTRPALL